MKKLYIIISSWDEYSDHYRVNECVCDSKLFAENKKIELENKYKQKLPFPFDWCTFEEFENLLNESKNTHGDFDIFIKWESDNLKIDTFNECFINEIDYYGLD